MITVCLRILLFQLATVTLLPQGAAVPHAEAAAPADYLRDVKPIFIRHCASCHGGIRQSGGLRLDTGVSILRGGESGAGIVPGKPEESLILQVLQGNAGFTMPPDGEGTVPAASQIALIRQWIEQGAEIPEEEKPQADPQTWWSFQPLARVELPDPDGKGDSQHPIDAFVRKQQRLRGLVPNPQAPPTVLLCRLYLDLIGVPPTLEELDQFNADPSEDAWRAVVDDLLNRPEYGERWGRHWMDVWRYSDWYGRRPVNEIRYGQRHLWRWRDWIISSLNEDKGYDRMVTEMLAGDELAPNDPKILAATGFLGRNWYKFDRNTWLFETVEQTSRGLMGMTMQCCRCHDHKYDPVSQVEYYQYRAFFEPHDFRVDPVGAARTEIDNGKESVLTDGLSRVYDKDLKAPTFLFRRGEDRAPVDDQPLDPQVPAALGRQGLSVQEVRLPPESFVPGLSASALEQAVADGEENVRRATKDRDGIQAEIARLQEHISVLRNADIAVAREPFIDDEFESIDPQKWMVVSGKWEAKDGRLTESLVTSFATIVSTRNHPRNFLAKARYRKLQDGRYRSVGFSYDYANDGRDSQDVYTARSDARPTGSVQAFHRVAGRQTYPQAGIRDTEITVGEWIDLEFEVRERSLTIRMNGELKLEYELPVERREGKFALWVHTGVAEFERLIVTPLIPTIPELRRAIVAAEHRQQVAEMRISVAKAEMQFQCDRIHAERARFRNADNFKELAQKAAHAERQVRLWKVRLEHLSAKRQVEVSADKPNMAALEKAVAELTAAQAAMQDDSTGYTQLKPEFPKTSTGRRLALARWLTRPDHPRTARVAVNHIWMRHFGEPLVASVDNFGLSGAEPTHPELLDWLAGELVSNNWSMRHIHRLIVTSRTWRLSSKAAVSGVQTDSKNTYLWRAHSRRAEAEVIRDSLLAVSGELDLTRGGPDLDEKQGQTSRRRSLYFRTTPDNQMQMLSLFDQANPDECYRRRESVIPQQALALLNGPLAIDLSRQLAAKLSERVPDGDDKQFVILAFRTILSRGPTQADLIDCLEFLTESAVELAMPEEARFPPALHNPQVDPSTDPRQHARESLIHALFNHNDFVTIR